MNRKVLKIGIMPKAKFQAYTIAIAKGKYKPKPEEPKIWFASMKTLAQEGFISLPASLMRRLNLQEGEKIKIIIEGKTLRKIKLMNRIEIENRLLHELHNLSVEKLEKTLDFVLSLKNHVFQERYPQNEDNRLIQKTSAICGGSPHIQNTRIPVRSLVQYRQLGTSDSELLEIYPTLKQPDLNAAWEYYKCYQKEIDQEIEEENSL